MFLFRVLVSGEKVCRTSSSVANQASQAEKGGGFVEVVFWLQVDVGPINRNHIIDLAGLNHPDIKVFSGFKFFALVQTS